MSAVFPVESSLLARQTLIERVLSAYDLPSPVTCELLVRGINDTYLVTAGHEKAILRVYIAHRNTQGQIQSEMAVLDYVAERGLAVPTGIRRKDGVVINPLAAPEGTRYAVLFPYVTGQPPDPLENGYLCGRTLAQLHTTIDNYPGRLARPEDDAANRLARPLERIAAFQPYTAYSEQLAYLREVCALLKNEMARLPRTTPEFGLCHGDFMAGNILLNDAGLLTLIDFDFCHYGWRVFDLATFVWITAVENHPGYKDVQAALLAGYESVRPLSAVERRAVDYFVLVRHIWLLGGGGLMNIHRHGIAFWTQNGYFERFIAFIKRWMDAIGG